ncbi:MAG: hypothetical protein IPP70_03000 [Elusimicrobia bacterium]|nr:hypothetical protein [Elusimicrobiota bacterium]MBL0360025.1 hypothetical protein [Elusimicrobiota bacterium]
MLRVTAAPSAARRFRAGAIAAALWALLAVVAFGLAQGQPPLRVSLLRALLPPPLAALAGPFHHVPALVGLMLFGLLTVGLGRAVLRRWRPLCFNFPETIGLSLAIGAGLLSAGVWCLGATGGLNTTGVAAITVLGLGVVAFDWTQHPPPIPRFRLGRVDGPTLLLWALPVAVLGITGLFALAPARFYDALVYHLALPKLYLLENRWVPTPTFLFGGFPMHTHALFAWALALGDARWAALVHWGFGVGAALLFWGAGERARNRFGGALSSAVFFSTPVVAFALPRAGVDVSTAFYTLAAVVLAGRALDEAPRARHVWLTAGLLVGWTMGIKYTNVPLGLVFPFLLWRLGLPRPSMARFLAGLTIAFLPWVVKNLVGYGNPVFPFLQGWWNPAGFPLDARAMNVDAWGRPWDNVFSGQWLLPFRWLLHPWTISLTGRSEFDFVGPLFLMGLPLLFFVVRDTKARRLGLLGLGAAWMAWWPFSGMPRFFLGGLALLAFLFGQGVSRLEGRRARWVLSLGLLLAATGPLTRGLYGLARDIGWEHLAQPQSRDRVLATPAGTYAAPAHPSMVWINRNAPADARVLVIGDARGYGLERPFRVTSALDVDWFLWVVRKAADGGEIARTLAGEGFTHLLVNPAEMARVGQPAGFTAEEFQRAARFWAFYTEKLFEDGSAASAPPRWSLVYRLVPRRETPAAGAIPWVDSAFQAPGEGGLK